MLLTKFRPDFWLTALAYGLEFHADSGSSFFFDYKTHLLGKATASKHDVPIPPALAMECSIARGQGTATELGGDDWHDTTPSSHTTGGGRRSFISIAFERALRGLTDGRAALLSWARDQGNRPVVWWPWQFSYDAYYGTLGPDRKAPLWKYDWNAPNGWDIFDPAHLESSALFAGAALGYDESLAHFTMLLAWMCSTFPGQLPGKPPGSVARGWTGSQQPRAVGWMLWFLARACLLGFDTCDEEFRVIFLAGLTPKQHLVAFLKDLLANPLPIGADHPDDRTMVDFKDGSGQIKGALGFQESILIAALGYVLRTRLVNDPLASQVRAWIDSRVSVVAGVAVDSHGLSYSFSRDAIFTQADVDKANTLETDAGHHYELVNPGNGIGVIRDQPRVADSELMAAALALLNGAEDVQSVELTKLHPDSGVDGYRSLAPYLDVVYGLRENGS